jgi:RNA polymerase-interacting CarD/CdnL/TRCF family regulator
LWAQVAALQAELAKTKSQYNNAITDKAVLESELRSLTEELERLRGLLMQFHNGGQQ